jgi:hypothetical protein
LWTEPLPSVVVMAAGGSGGVNSSPWKRRRGERRVAEERSVADGEEQPLPVMRLAPGAIMLVRRASARAATAWGGIISIAPSRVLSERPFVTGPTLSQSGLSDIRARHGPEDCVVASVLGTDALHPGMRARSFTQIRRGPAPKCGHHDHSNRRRDDRRGETRGVRRTGGAGDRGSHLPAAAHRPPAGPLQGDGRRRADHLVRAGASTHSTPARASTGRSTTALAPDVTLLLVQPNAGDVLEQNLNPVGRTYDGLSTVICTPGSPAQEVGLGLNAQDGERRLAVVLLEAGFNHVRRATKTPFNIIVEARP